MRTVRTKCCWVALGGGGEGEVRDRPSPFRAVLLHKHFFTLHVIPVGHCIPLRALRPVGHRTFRCRAGGGGWIGRYAVAAAAGRKGRGGGPEAGELSYTLCRTAHMCCFRGHGGCVPCPRQSPVLFRHVDAFGHSNSHRWGRICAVGAGAPPESQDRSGVPAFPQSEGACCVAKPC